jgi:hypothetical protein
MVSLSSLILPIVLSAVFVFIVSSVIHMLLTYHRGDVARVPREDEALDAMRRLDLAPGDYMAPHAGSPEGMRKPEFVEKMKRGPIVLMTVIDGGSASMSKSLVMWFGFSLIVSLFAGYIASRALGPGADYREVFRFVGTTAFMGYGLALAQDSIWSHRKWSTTLKSMVDALIYGMFTAGTFGWLWPTQL